MMPNNLYQDLTSDNVLMEAVSNLIQHVADYIFDHNLQAEDKDPHMLWSILGAIRGPDTHEFPSHQAPNSVTFSERDNLRLLRLRIKTATTQKIRDWIILKYYPSFKDPARKLGLKESLSSAPEYTRDQIGECCGNHFLNHLVIAERAIKRLDKSFKLFKYTAIDPDTSGFAQDYNSTAGKP